MTSNSTAAGAQKSETTERPIKIVAISGSLRRGSFNTALLHVAAEAAPDNVMVEFASIADLPLYNRDEEVAIGFPPAVARLRRQVASGDGLLLASPEYNYSVTGALKNALDWLSRSPAPIDRMPVAVLSGAGRLGGVRGLTHLRDILRHNDMQVVGRPEVLVTAVSSKFDQDGEFTDDRVRNQMARLLVGLRRNVVAARSNAARVLVVGRNDDIVRSAMRMLSAEGHRPVAAAEVDDAFREMKARPFESLLIGDEVETNSAERLETLAADMGIRAARLARPGDVTGALEASLA